MDCCDIMPGGLAASLNFQNGKDFNKNIPVEMLPKLFEHAIPTQFEKIFK